MNAIGGRELPEGGSLVLGFQRKRWKGVCQPEEKSREPGQKPVEIGAEI